MMTMQTMIDQLEGTAILETLLSAIEHSFPDFPEIQQRYTQAMAALQAALGADTVQKEQDAISRQITSGILFSGVLGIQANFKYFSDPVSGNFLSSDPEVYLRENTARHLPDYIAAQKVRCEFYSKLDTVQKELYQPVTEYTSYLETVVPKLSHYFGFVLGNTLLQQVVPGYHPDLAFTLQYCMRLEAYFADTLSQKNLLNAFFAFADDKI